MRNQLTQEHVGFYNQNGFLVIENFLDTDELERWQSWTQEAVDQRLVATGGKDFSETLTNQSHEDAYQSDEDRYFAQVFTQCLKLADTHSGMRKLLLNPDLGKIAATLAGVDGVRMWHDQALFKPPFGNPTAWHLDDPDLSFFSPDAISLWIALDDATLGNGCMWYLPGTHKSATYDSVGLGGSVGDLFHIFPQWREIDPVACPCPAGTAIYHNGLTAHGAGANMTNRTRRAMTCIYMPDGATFNGYRNSLPKDYFDSLRVGDVLRDDVLHPLVWHRDLNG